MLWIRISCLAALLALFGCGPPAPTPVKVSGTVKYDGKPIGKGSIAFVGMEAGSAPEVLTITGGLFEGTVTAGKKKVEILGMEPNKGPKPTGPGADKASNEVNFLPAKYNSATTVAKDVSAPGPHKFDFDLEK